ncbi:putative MFS family arabinose efflux permease [Rhodoligotrophos appendicifer]
MNTVNALGYLAGALISSLVSRFLGMRRTTILGAVMVTAALAVSGLSGDFTLLSTARLVAGLGGALSFVAGGTLASQFSGHASNPARMLGLFYIGPSVGILLSGLAIPSILETLGAGSWRVAWLVMAAASGLLIAILILAGPQDQQRVGVIKQRHAPLIPMIPILVGYLFFGTGYIAYMTFMIAWVQQSGGGAAEQTAFWSAIAISAIISTSFWSSLVAQMTGGRGVGAMIGLTSIGAALPLVIPGYVGLLVSALLFGTSFFSVVSATTIFIRKYYPADAWASGIASMTVCFSLGQVIGPVAIGYMSDASGGLTMGLWISAAVLVLGALISSLQPAPGNRT